MAHVGGQDTRSQVATTCVVPSGSPGVCALPRRRRSSSLGASHQPVSAPRGEGGSTSALVLRQSVCQGATHHPPARQPSSRSRAPCPLRECGGSRHSTAAVRIGHMTGSVPRSPAVKPGRARVTQLYVRRVRVVTRDHRRDRPRHLRGADLGGAALPRAARSTVARRGCTPLSPSAARAPHG